MSRLAKKPVPVPQGVTISLEQGGLKVKGPKGELDVRLPAAVAMEAAEDGVKVTTAEQSKQGRANAGTAWALVRNAVKGVTEGYEKNLEIEGVGFRAAVEGSNLVLSLGYVNPVRFPIPAGVTIVVEKNVIKIAGINKELVGQVAASVRALKKPEPYKGKGIRYQGEVIRRKVGKKAATS
jgi:large subunit ribosomal protein L6